MVSSMEAKNRWHTEDNSYVIKDSCQLNKGNCFPMWCHTVSLQQMIPITVSLARRYFWRLPRTHKLQTEHSKWCEDRHLTNLLLGRQEKKANSKSKSFCCHRALWCEIQTGSLRSRSRAVQVATHKPPVGLDMLLLAALRPSKSRSYFPHPHVCYGIHGIIFNHLHCSWGSWWTLYGRLHVGHGEEDFLFIQNSERHLKTEDNYRVA